MPDGGDQVDAPGTAASSLDSGAVDAGNTPGRDAGAGEATGPLPGSSDGGLGARCTSDPALPAEPQIPPACTTLDAAQTVAATAVADETTLDTARIQAALNGCAQGQAVRLAPSGSKNGFVTGPLTVPSGVSLWVKRHDEYGG